MRYRRPIARPASGFSLLEVLVAFAIMALSLGLLYRSLGSSVDTVGRLAWRQQATSLIGSLLQANASTGPTGWNETGQTERLQWQVVSQPLPVPAIPGGLNASPTPPLVLHQVTITVTHRQQPGQALVVQTLRPQNLPTPGDKAP